MNQILVTENTSSRSKNSNKKNRSGGPVDIKKVMVFFACSIIIFGIAMAGLSAYRTYTNIEATKNADVPSISISSVEESVAIKASYSKGISKIVYYWNEANKMQMVADGKTSMEVLVNNPPIGNVINVQLVGLDGTVVLSTNKTIENLMPDNGETVINITSSEDGSQIQISAINGAGLQYLTYRLNDGQETKVDAPVNAGNGNTLTMSIPININNLPVQVGQNTIYVTAVDIAGKSTDYSKPINGKNEPVITIVRDGDVLNCKITHDAGFSKIEFNLNGQVFVYDENSRQYNKDSTTFTIKIPLQSGNNKVTVTATGTDGAVATYKGETTL